jgi:2'-5' RNA ligase
MRLFVAIALDAPARQAIAALQRRLADSARDRAKSLRFVRAEHLHLTLVFIGNREPDEVPSIVAVLQHGIPLAPFRLSFGGVDMFPDERRPRALFLGVLDGAAAAVRLQDEIAGRLERAGVPRERRPFHPHLTLARFRERERSPGRHIISESRREVAAIDVKAAVLYESRLSPEGPTYSALASAPLEQTGSAAARKP